MTDDVPHYQVAVVGGGPAGLSAALYTTRLGHDTAVFDRGGGRAAMMQETHNLVGVDEATTGHELKTSAREQLEAYGTRFRDAFVTDVERLLGTESDDDPGFRLATTDGPATADRLVLATGFSDARPAPPLPRTGRGLHYCLHCDAYMFVDRPVFVMGHGESAAHVAMIMLNVTDDVDLLLRGEDPTWSDETDRQLRAHPVDVVEADVAGVTNGEDGWLESMTFEDGVTREYTGGFAMYGSEYNASLAHALGVDLTDDGTVAVDDHGRTSVDGVYAVGDLTPGHNQVPVAIGDGAKTGIAVHYDTRTFPVPLGEIEDADGAVPAAPAMSAELRAVARQHPGRAGGPADAGSTDEAGEEVTAAENDDTTAESAQSD